VTNPVDPSEGEPVARLQVREYANIPRQHIPGCEEGYVNDTGRKTGIRQTRTVTGIATLTNDDVLGRGKSPDAIAASPWPTTTLASSASYAFSTSATSCSDQFIYQALHGPYSACCFRRFGNQRHKITTARFHREAS